MNNLYYIIGYVCAVIISIFFVDKVIQFIYVKMARYYFKDKYPYNIKRFLHLELGASIGKVERFIYIYSVIVGNHSIMAGWLVLKAFFGWVKPFPHRQHSLRLHSKDNSELITFYLYVYGNGLSLLFGILLGHLALLISDILRFSASLKTTGHSMGTIFFTGTMELINFLKLF